MKTELLIAAVNADPAKLISQMRVNGNACLINQCDHDSEETIQVKNGLVRVFSYNERGVGLSRNHALEHSTGDILLFADEDIVYEDNYETLLRDEFTNHPEADAIFFNIKVGKDRETYWNDEFKKVGRTNTGRYGIVSLAVRADKVKAAGLHFSPLFGGGAKYSAGEDSLFIMDMLNAGFNCYASPVCLGTETERESSWFKGYNEKFFFDRGVLYHFLYKKAAVLISLRFILKHKEKLCTDIKPTKAIKLMLKGIKEGKSIRP